MRLMPILVLVPVLFSAAARADPIFITDGGTHDVDSSDSAYILQSGTLNILPSSIALAASTEPLTGASATISMTGGQVNDGIDIGGGTINVSGGVVNAIPALEFGTDALADSGTANISGGTFTGGNVTAGNTYSAEAAGNGVMVYSMGTLNISGGTFSGGTGAGGYYGGSTGYSLESLGHATITGGNFLSPIAIVTASGGQTSFFGTNLAFTNGILSGVLKDGDPINVQILGGFGSVVVSANGTEVSFSSSGSGSSGSGSSGSSGSGSSGSGPSSSGSSGSNPPTPTPEPSSFLLFGALGAAFAWARHRRSR
jgi:hypothetical protein